MIAIEVVKVATEPGLSARRLTRNLLDQRIAEARRTVEEWAKSARATALFDELDSDTLALESEQRIDFEFRRGAIDQKGGPRAPRLAPERQLREGSEASLRMVVGERGSGRLQSSPSGRWKKRAVARRSSGCDAERRQPASATSFANTAAIGALLPSTT